MSSNIVHGIRRRKQIMGNFNDTCVIPARCPLLSQYFYQIPGSIMPDTNTKAPIASARSHFKNWSYHIPRTCEQFYKVIRNTFAASNLGETENYIFNYQMSYSKKHRFYLRVSIIYCETIDVCSKINVKHESESSNDI